VKVEFEITPDMLACWSGKGDVWTVEPGEFTLMVGSSSADKDLQSLSLHVD
jgi:beta-glucosidase